MSKLEFNKPACCSELKTDERCSGCLRDVSLNVAASYEHWVKPYDIKSFSGGVAVVKCSSYLKGG